VTKIGLEIHCQLTKLESKLFCPCKADYREFEPNTNICPVCMGIPGSLPLLNKKAVEKDYAESIILGCTAEFGFYRTLQEEIGVPIIDPSLAALKKAEHHANLKRRFNLIPSRRWSCESPSDEEIKKFGLFKDENPFGNRIVVN